MSIYYKHGDKVEFDKTAVALGTFDGLHIAHMKIINKAKEYAALNNIKCGVHTFSEIPANIMGKSVCTRLMSNKDKAEILSDIDFVYMESFDEAFYSKTPQEFVKYLKETLKAVAISAGYNYRFGKNAEGDVNTLKNLCAQEGIKVFILDKSEQYGEPVSSSRIRKLISDGDIKTATTLLGRPYFITGVVEKGLQNGRKMGFPTANLAYQEDMTIPKTGVYIGFCTVDGIRNKAIINVGNNPTFNGTKIKIECHLLDFNQDLYDKEIKVEFIDYLRGEVRFESKDLLQMQIKKDAENAERKFKDYE